MQLHITKDINDLSRKFAYWLVEHIHATLQHQDRYTWALSGGSTPQKLFGLLAAAPFRDKIPWEKLHFFWGDERAVPFDDPRNNGRMAYDVLLQHVPVPAAQIHYMRTDIAPAESAAAYEKILRSYFGEKEISFDLVMLGMGDDGHTLSLFPGTAVIHEQQKWVDAFYLDAQEMYRITLTAPVVNRAACVAFLAAGEQKAVTLKSVLEGNYQPDLYPSQVIRPLNGELHWFVDEAAASLLQA